MFLATIKKSQLKSGTKVVVIDAHALFHAQSGFLEIYLLYILFSESRSVFYSGRVVAQMKEASVAARTPIEG